MANVIPVDLASPNRMPIAEYREYRRLVGPLPQAPGGRFQTLWIDRKASG